MRELALHLLDVARNSIEAGATSLQLAVVEDEEHDRLVMEIADNGRGMHEQTLRRATDSFFTTRRTRRQGLGLPLLKATCERCGGHLTIHSKPLSGTRVVAEMQLSHVDRPPLGDMGALIQALACEAERVHLTYRHTVAGARFGLDTNELQYELDDVFLRNPLVLDWLRQHVNESLQELRELAREARA